MPKCWIHGETAQQKPKPLKTVPSHPEPNFKETLGILLADKPKIRDLSIQPYRHWEFEKFTNEIKELKKSLNDFKEKTKKQEEKFSERLEQKTQEITELNNKLNQLITRILNISEKPTGTFDPELTKQKGIKELLEKYKVKSIDELVLLVDKAVKNHQELLTKIEELDIDGEREREEKGV